MKIKILKLFQNVEPTSAKILSSTRKYRIASDLTKKLNQLMAEAPMRYFPGRVETVKELAAIWERGDEATVHQADSTELLHEEGLEADAGADSSCMYCLYTSIQISTHAIKIDRNTNMTVQTNKDNFLSLCR